MTPAGSSGLGAPGDPPPFALVVAVALTGIMGNVLLIPALPDIAADLAVPRGRIGLVLAATTAPGILLAPVIGLLADRFGRRRVLVPCLALFGLSGGLGAFAPSFPVLVVLRALQGVGSAGLINLAVVIIGDHWVGVERARRIGRNAAILTASLVVLPPVGGLLTEVGGWRATFVLGSAGHGRRRAGVAAEVDARCRHPAGPARRHGAGPAVVAGARSDDPRPPCSS